MPSRPNIPCKHPGCPKLIPYKERYCEEHKKLHPEEIRSAAKRGYDRRWQKERKRFLEAHPLCDKCKAEGRYVKATVVDHIIPHRGNKDLFWDENNYQALCKHCHDVKTMTEDANIEYKY